MGFLRVGTGLIGLFLTPSDHIDRFEPTTCKTYSLLLSYSLVPNIHFQISDPFSFPLYLFIYKSYMSALSYIMTLPSSQNPYKHG